MMKKNFKKFIFNAASIVAVMAMILPVVSLAAAKANNGNGNSASGAGAAGKTGVCLQAGNLSSKID